MTKEDSTKEAKLKLAYELTRKDPEAMTDNELDLAYYVIMDKDVQDVLEKARELAKRAKHKEKEK